jgi:regulator of replication initiation timing
MSGSVRALRRIYGRLHAEGHINNKATILVRAGEKLVSENKILRIENEGLRGVIFEKKRKRKRGKALNFHKKGEQAGQALFFSLIKITRTRERAAALEETEFQR